MPRYEFTLTLTGEGPTEEDAWEDACEAFAADPGVAPEPGVVIPTLYECLDCGWHSEEQLDTCPQCEAEDSWSEI